MGRRKLFRCMMCRQKIHEGAIAIVFFTRIGDTFTEEGLSEDMADTVEETYCRNCAEIIREMIRINQKSDS